MGITERREREKEQRRNDIINAAERVIFSKGLDSATMDEVAEEAELSKGTLYLYFKSKGELYFAIINRGMEILFNLFNEAASKKTSGIDKVRNIGGAFIEFSREYPNYFKAFLDSNSMEFDFTNANAEEMKNLPFKKKSMEILIESIQMGIDEGGINKDLEPKKTAVLLWAHLNGLLQLIETKKGILERFFEVEVDEILEYHFQYTLRALT